MQRKYPRVQCHDALQLCPCPCRLPHPRHRHRHRHRRYLLLLLRSPHQGHRRRRHYHCGRISGRIMLALPLLPMRSRMSF